MPGGSAAPAIVADSRTNALIVKAPNPARMAQIRSIVEKLDRPQDSTSPAGNIYVVYLKNADATRLATVLRAAHAAGQTTGQGGAAGGGGGARPRPPRRTTRTPR